MKVSQGFARVRDGTPIGYSVHGDAAASRAAVLVHSLAMDRHFWDPVADRLASQGAVLVYDCRGHGASGAGGKSYSVAQFADDLADLMSELRWEKALVAGASMGGCVALSFAERHPQRTVALGLIDTTAWYGEEAPAQWEERARKALEGRLDSLVDFQVTRWFSDAFRAAQPQLVAAAVAVFLRNDPQSYAASCRMLGAADLRRALGAPQVGSAEHTTACGIRLRVVSQEHRDSRRDQLRLRCAKGVAEPARNLEVDERVEAAFERLARALFPLGRRFLAVPSGGVDQPERYGALRMALRKRERHAASHRRAGDERLFPSQLAHEIGEVVGELRHRIGLAARARGAVPAAVVDEHRALRGEPVGDRVPEMAVHCERVHQYRGARSRRIAVHAVADGSAVAHAREALRDFHPRANLAHTSRTPSRRHSTLDPMIDASDPRSFRVEERLRDGSPL